MYKLPVEIDSKADQAVTEDAGDDEYDEYRKKNQVHGANDAQAVIGRTEICLERFFHMFTVMRIDSLK